MLIFDKCEKIHRLFDKINANLVLSSNVFQTRKTVSYADVIKRLRGYFEYTFSIREGMDRKFQFEEWLLNVIGKIQKKEKKGLDSFEFLHIFWLVCSLAYQYAVFS